MKTHPANPLLQLARRCTSSLRQAATVALIATSVLGTHAQHSAPAKGPAGLEYSLETIAFDSAERNVVYHTRDHIKAPNWSRDGKFQLFNFKSGFYKLPIISDDTGELSDVELKWNESPPNSTPTTPPSTTSKRWPRLRPFVVVTLAADSTLTPTQPS